MSVAMPRSHDPRGGVRSLHPDRAVPAHHLGARGRPRAAGHPRLDRPAARPRAWCAPSCRWTGEAGTGGRIASALRGWDNLRYEVTEEPSPGTRRLALVAHPRPRHPPHLGLGHRRRHGQRGPPARTPSRTARATRTRCSARSTGCWAPTGTTSSSRSATPATARRCAGCTRSADPPGRAASAGHPMRCPALPCAPAPVRRARGDAERRRRQTLRNARATLWPPKPNELFSAAMSPSGSLRVLAA